MKRRVPCRTGRRSGLVSIVVGAVFVGVGIFAVIPALGAFGGLWTLTAIGITAANVRRFFEESCAGPERTVEDGQAEQPDVRERLDRLNGLYAADLLTEEEYHRRRQELLRER